MQQRIGKDLLDDPQFLKRVEEGTVEVPEALKAKYAAMKGGSASAGSVATASASGGSGAEVPSARASKPVMIEHPVPKGGMTAAMIFVAGTLVIVLFGLFPDLRPAFPDENGELVPIGMTTIIEMVMFTVALLIILVRRVKPSVVVEQPLLRAGFTAAVALFGIAWMADTFISANEETIIEPLGEMITSNPLLARRRPLPRGRSDHQPVRHHEHADSDRAGGGSRSRHRHRDVAVARRRMALPGERLADRGGRDRPHRVDQTDSGAGLALVHHSHAGAWVAVVVAGLLIQLVVPA